MENIELFLHAKKRSVMNINIIEKVVKYFAGREVEKFKKSEETRENKLITEEMRGRKELHYMRCPKCGMSLKEIEYKGVKIDKCAQCDGIWLDAGELEAVLLSEKIVIENIFRTFMKQLN